MSNSTSETDNRPKEFQEIIRLTYIMVTLAEDKKWDEISPVQLKRQSLLVAFFDGEVSLDEAAWVEEGVNEILRLDKIIMEKGKDAVNIISSEYDLVSKSQKASNAYLANR